MRPRPPLKEKTVPVVFSLGRYDQERLRAIAEKEKLPISKTLEKILDAYFLHMSLDGTVLELAQGVNSPEGVELSYYDIPNKPRYKQ